MKDRLAGARPTVNADIKASDRVIGFCDTLAQHPDEAIRIPFFCKRHGEKIRRMTDRDDQ